MKEKIDIKNLNLPKHIAIILDGNGRWAKSFAMPRNYGHKKGADNLIKIAKYADEIGVENLTVFAFSTENWSRPKDEVNYLMNLLKENFNKILNTDISSIRIKVIGERHNLNEDLLSCINNIEEKTKNNNGLKLNIAFNYGSRDEILNACKNVIDNKEDLTKDNISKYLYVNDVDLLIRTSGEKRISNFLLWQISYSELYFTKVHWPAFSKKDFDRAIYDYNKRNRRFGGLKEEK